MYLPTYTKNRNIYSVSFGRYFYRTETVKPHLLEAILSMNILSSTSRTMLWAYI